MCKNLIMALALLALLAWSARAAPEPPWNDVNNCSGTITTGGTAQKIAHLPNPLHGYQIQDLSTDVLGFSEFTTTPAVGSNGTWQIAASGGSYTSPSSYAPSASIYIIGATTGDAFTCAAW